MQSLGLNYVSGSQMEVEQFLERIRIALKVWLPDLAKEEEEEEKKNQDTGD